MAQAGSAQREPSMEEILASIRRIIEDSDNSAKHDAPQAVTQPEFGEEPAAAHGKTGFAANGSASVAEIASFRQGLGAGAATREVEARRNDEPIAAEDAVADMDFVENLSSADPEAIDETEAFELDLAEAFDSFDADLAEESEPEAAREHISESFEPNELAQDAPLSAEPKQAAGSVVSERVAESVEAANSPAIISEGAGRKVSAAFEELSEAFEASRRRSFDEMAEEMLRPMLQDWLDNNLPKLVERLVREEIERVARGGSH